MLLTIEQTASRLGKSTRQIRYQIKNGQIAAQKVGGRWLIETADLPLSERQQQTLERKERQLRAAVTQGLGLDEDERQPRYSVRQLRAIQIILPLLQQISETLGAQHPATLELRQTLAQLCLGCHRFEQNDKSQAYRQAREHASLAICELLLSGHERADEFIDEIEQQLMATLAGLLRRLEPRKRR
jgi:excisionase family DNA binding protein